MTRRPIAQKALLLAAPPSELDVGYRAPPQARATRLVARWLNQFGNFIHIDSLRVPHMFTVVIDFLLCKRETTLSRG